jgi:Uncharacterized conserved protein
VEIQHRPSDYPIPVRRVGFSGVLRRITIKSPEGHVQLTARIDLYVEVSPDRKGAHLSRNIDAINLLERIPEESWSLEGFAETLHKELLELHPYSSSAVVKLKTTYWVPAEFLDIKGLEPVSVRIFCVRRQGEEDLLDLRYRERLNGMSQRADHDLSATWARGSDPKPCPEGPAQE